MEANPHNSLEPYARIPGVMGVVRCHENNDVIEQSNPEVAPFGNILMFFKQMASLLGESFGLEELAEAHIQGKEVSAVCLAKGEETFGFIVRPMSRAADVVAQVATIRGEA